MAATLASVVCGALGIEAAAVAAVDATTVAGRAEQLSELLRTRATWLLVEADTAACRDEPISPGRLQAAVDAQLADRAEQARAQERALRDATHTIARLRGDIERAGSQDADLDEAVKQHARERAEFDRARAALCAQNDDLQQRLATEAAQVAQEKARFAEERTRLEATASVLAQQLEVKSEEIKATVAAGRVAVPIHKGNQFEGDFFRFVRECVFDLNPCLSEYKVTRTGGGKKDKAGDLIAATENVEDTLVAMENKANGSRDKPVDVSAKETAKFYRDVALSKARAGIIVSRYGGISNCTGSSIVRDVEMQGNILFIPRFHEQNPQFVAAMITYWVLAHGIRAAGPTRGDVPTQAMQDTVQQYAALVQANRKAVNATIEMEQLLHGAVRRSIMQLAAYNCVNVAKSKGVAACVQKRAAPAPLPMELTRPSAPHAIAPTEAARAEPPCKRPRAAAARDCGTEL